MRHAFLYKHTFLNQLKTVEEEVNNRCILYCINDDSIKTRQTVYV
jgi:hypothetical protein